MQERDNNAMRRPEVKVSVLLNLVKRDYVDNDQRSLGTLCVHIDNHLNPELGERSAERLKSYDIEQYKEKRKKEGAANATINLELAALRRAYTLGMQQELVSKKPNFVLYSVGNSNARTGFFEHSDYEKQMKALLPYAQPIFQFGYLTGWREGEIFSLRWDTNYDAEGETIYLLKKNSKNKKGRTFPLLDVAGEPTELWYLIEERKAARCTECDCQYIFHYECRPCNRNTFNKHWRAACRQSGVHRHFHDLRRTAVRNLTRAGVPKVIAKQITGHLTDDIYDRYDIVSEDDIQQAMARVSSYLKRKNGNGETAKTGLVPETGPEVPESLQEVAERAGFEPACDVNHNTISSLGVVSKCLSSFKNLVNKLVKRG